MQPVFADIHRIRMECLDGLMGKARAAVSYCQADGNLPRCGKDIMLLTVESPKSEFAAPCKACGRRHFYQPADVKTVPAPSK
jgi:DNA-directed RNA polymerase subunit RPC12/RpoP